MKSKSNKTGFTIVELLTVMSIIIILMGVLVPALAKVRRFAKVVVQKGQFHEISKGLELYRNDHGDIYPDSGAIDTDPAGPFGYCGAMKMCEALIGQDGMGFHPSARFYASGIGTDPTTGLDTDIYPFDLCASTDPASYSGATADPFLKANIQERVKYIDAENVKMSKLQKLYNWPVTGGVSFYDVVAFQASTDTTPYAFPNAVICDVFQRATSICNGAKTGMPVLYYKADPSKMVHDVNTVPVVGTPNPNIYNFDDNYAITSLGCPWEGGATKTTDHPMFTDPRIFLKEITNTRITTTPRPHNEDGYILMSAGWDGLYGTRDDVFNFTD
jgi:type II secretory pathway pseudopilin PulG